MGEDAVKTIYNVTRYNRIFNIDINLQGTDLFQSKFPLYNRIFIKRHRQ